MMEEIVGLIIILMGIRMFLTKNKAEKIFYGNVIGFAVSALIALFINSPFGLIVAIAFFLTSTISYNAIAFTLNRLENEITYDE